MVLKQVVKTSYIPIEKDPTEYSQKLSRRAYKYENLDGEEVLGTCNIINLRHYYSLGLGLNNM